MATSQNPFLDPSPEMDMADEPLPPPDHVLMLIPPFNHHGEHKCGYHRHGLKKNFAKYVRRFGGDTESATWNVACRNCRCLVTLNRVHELPCGDLICRDCLMVRAFNVKLNIEKHHRRIQSVRERREDLETSFIQSQDMSREGRDKFIQDHDDIRRVMFRLAGLMCCGVDMQLERFLGCMTPAASRDLWLAIRWVCDPRYRQRICGWPDCGAVPVLSYGEIVIN
ncbi:hypothetical protein F5144DRAFT_491615 [Chaetomium tenue]|uniref:Uncharacterized protein n=1 Tax=Chaetomium tenue TaxID=1854479 RepID=A0ACB7PA76_9PEZI|nr:hypothetical protein F5144DRAFT_491615 [Chaetomium globosum]